MGNLEALSIALIVGTLTAVYGVIRDYFNYRRERQEAIKRLEEAEKAAQTKPEKAKPAWDVARITLEQYFRRNLSDLRYIFWVSIIVMLIGFGIIIWGIARAILNPDEALTAAITVGAGVITEIIGATLLSMYRSSLTQAMSYTETLERINAVGMAMQILDTIPDEAGIIKEQTKADLIKDLMLQHTMKTSE